MFHLYQNNNSADWLKDWRYNFEYINKKYRVFWCREDLKHKKTEYSHFDLKNCSTKIQEIELME